MNEGMNERRTTRIVQQLWRCFLLATFRRAAVLSYVVIGLPAPFCCGQDAVVSEQGTKAKLTQFAVGCLATYLLVNG